MKIRKILLVLLITLTTFGLTGCGFVDRIIEAYKNTWEMTFGTKHDNEEEKQTFPNLDNDFDPNAPIEIKSINVDEIFDTSNKCFNVTWYFSQDDLYTFLKADADIRIVIKNDDDTTVYDKNYSVTDDDYQIIADFEKYKFYKGLIKISTSDVTPGTSSSGKMYVYAKLKNGGEFNPVIFSITNHLPIKTMSITANTPAVVDIKDYRGQIDKRIEINEFEVIASPYVSSVADSYQRMTAKVKLTYNMNGNEVNDFVTFSFKIKDSSGVIVSSGMCMTGRLKVGETISCDIQATGKFDLKQNYTIEFEDYR